MTLFYIKNKKGPVPNGRDFGPSIVGATMITLKEYINLISKLKKESSKAGFLINIVESFMQDPFSNETIENPLINYNDDTLRSFCNGTKHISKECASKIRSLYDKDKFISFIYERTDNFDDFTEQLINLGFEDDLYYDGEIDIPATLADLLAKIFEDISKGENITYPPIRKIETKTLDREAFKNAYIKDGILHINNKTIELPETISLEDSCLKCDLPYVIELLKVYSSICGNDIKSLQELQSYPAYEKHLLEQSKCYYSAEAMRRSVRDLFDDGEDHFNILKNEIFDSIYETYVDLSLNDGYQRLKNVLDMATKAELNSTILLNIKGLITVKERKGICHILVNEGRIKSWVEVDYE